MPPAYPGQPAPDGPPPYPGQPAPSWGPPQWGAAPPAYGYGQTPPYAAPPPLAPRPGVIPLRPLSLGEILDGAVRTIRHNPKVMLGFSAILIGITGVVTAVVQVLTLHGFVNGLQGGSLSGDNPFNASVIGDGIAATLIPALLEWAVTTVLTGVLVIAVSDAVLGRRPSLGEVWRRARGKILPLFGLTILTALAGLGLVLLAALPGFIVLVSTGGGSGTAIAVLLFVLGGIGALVGLIWIATRWLFAAPALLLEDLGVTAAFGRSWRLVAGSWWRVFGIWLLAQLLAGIVGEALAVPFAILGAVVGAGAGSGGVALAVSTLLSTLGHVVATTLVAPFSAAILALLYIDLRMRREGLDVTLIRAAAAEGATPGGGGAIGPPGIAAGTDPATPRW